MEGEVAVADEILGELEVGREEEVVAEEQFLQEEDSEMQQGPQEEWLERELVAQEQFFVEGEYVMQVVEAVPGNEVLVAGEEILWELEVWREVEVMAGEELVVEEKDDEIQQQPYREQGWEDEGMEREVAIEEIFLELEVGREEEITAEEELVRKEEHEVQQGEESKEQCRKEEGLEEVVVVKGQFMEKEESEMQQGSESEEHTEDKEGLLGELGVQGQFFLWQEGIIQDMWVGEEVFPDMQLGRQEEVVSEELRLEEQAPGVLQGPDWQEEGWVGEQLIAGEQFVQDGEREGTMEAMELVGEAEPQSEDKAKPQKAKPVQQEQVQPEPTGKSTWSPLEMLQALQLEMEPMNEQARRAFSRLRRRMWQRLKPYFERRSLNIQRIPGFWATARPECRLLDTKQFVNHPVLSTMISVQDENILRHMIDLKVREVRHSENYCTISLYFHSNPYFLNNVIVKEYLITVTGYRASRATPIQWYQHCEREAYSHRHWDSTLSLFNWFSDHSLAGSGRIAEIISKDLWLNPLKYYRRTMASGKK